MWLGRCWARLGRGVCSTPTCPTSAFLTPSPSSHPSSCLQLTAEEHFENAEMAFAMENYDQAAKSFRRALDMEPEVRLSMVLEASPDRLMFVCLHAGLLVPAWCVCFSLGASQSSCLARCAYMH